jgi:hypothetical protein
VVGAKGAHATTPSASHPPLLEKEGSKARASHFVRRSKENRSLTAKAAKDAKEKNSFTAKEIIIRTKAKPEGREGTAPRVAYKERFWSYYRHA